MQAMLKISFPHIGDYHVPIRRLFMDLFPQAEVFSAPPITQRTVELGARHSPDFVCSPFKYNIGNYIEALEAGANLLFQTGMGCRYGYYGEVQRRILLDLGYAFSFICFSRERGRLDAAYRICKELNPRLTFPGFLQAVALAAERIRIMDRLDFYLRERIGFEVQPGAFLRHKRALLEEIDRAHSFMALRGIERRYWGLYQAVEIRQAQRPLRVGMVGELYTLMEPFSNHYLERQLAHSGIVVSRRMSATFLLFGRQGNRPLRQSRGYLRYQVGANGVDSVAQGRQYAQRGYDGIVHIKSFGCTPELNAQPALMNLGRDMNIPILHLSFDTQTSETGLQSRVEAFADMIKMKRDQCDETASQSGRGRGLHIDQGRIS